MISTERTSQEHQSHILALLQDRNPTVLPELYQYGPLLEYNLALKFRNLIGAEDLRDIVCDAMVRAFITGHRFDPRIANLKTWLNTLAHFQALTFLRQRMDAQSLNDLAGSLAVEAVLHSSTHTTGPSQDIEDLLEFLPPRCAQMIRDYYYEGYSFEEIADRYGMKATAVRVELSRGRDRLRRLLSE